MFCDNRDISYLIVTLNLFAWRSIHTLEELSRLSVLRTKYAVCDRKWRVLL